SPPKRPSARRLAAFGTERTDHLNRCLSMSVNTVPVGIEHRHIVIPFLSGERRYASITQKCSQNTFCAWRFILRTDELHLDKLISDGIGRLEVENFLHRYLDIADCAARNPPPPGHSLYIPKKRHHR